MTLRLCTFALRTGGQWQLREFSIRERNEENRHFLGGGYRVENDDKRGFFFCFFFKLYIIVLVLPNIKMNPPQVYMCSPSWTLLPPPSPNQPSGSSPCTSPKHPVSCIEPGLATRFIHDILHVSMPFSQRSSPCFRLSSYKVHWETD